MRKKSWLKVRSIGQSFDGGCLKLVRRGGKWKCEDKAPSQPRRFHPKEKRR